MTNGAFTMYGRAECLAVEGAATPEAMATFTDGCAGMTMGWTGSFDKLEAVLANGGPA